MRDNIMILGAAGFIGTNLAVRFLKQNKKVILFDKPGMKYTDIVEEAIKTEKACCIEGSFTEMGKENGWKDFTSSLEKVDTVYHLISTTCPTNSNQNAAIEMEDNVISTIYFLNACVDAKIKKVVFLSSGGTVYGKEHKGICRENEEAFPITMYGIQKLCIEKILYLYESMYNLDYRIIRLANPYGPYQRPNGIQGVVTTFLWRTLHKMPIEVYGDGSVVRDYIYIEDAIDGIINIAEKSGNYKLYNLGCGIGYTINDVIKTIENVTGIVPNIVMKPGRKVDVPVNILDISRYQNDYGEARMYTLTEGVAELAEFFKKRSVE